MFGPCQQCRIRPGSSGAAAAPLTELADARDLSELDPPVEKRHLARGVFKIGFAVADLDAARTSLEALGIPLRGEPITEPDGGMRSLRIEDPGGNVIQLFELLKPASQDRPVRGVTLFGGSRRPIPGPARRSTLRIRKEAR